MSQQISLSVNAPHPSLAPLSSYLVPQSQSLSGWFAGDSSANCLEPARQAFDNALKAFRTDLSEEVCSKWLSSATTIFDVEQAVISAKQQYEKKSPKSRTRRWLTSCSSRLMYYSVIMDTLAQHHPEYVSLAWGAIKFLFIAVLNHEELLTEISKTVAKIADVLPRADLCSNLYPTQRMKFAVAELYAKVMYFVQDAIRWYKKGKLAHSISAVFKPYALGFKTIVEDISEASRRVDQEASAASKAEIRELHIKLQQFAQSSMSYFSSQSLATINVAEGLAHQTAMLRQQQMIQITSAPALSHLPNAEEALKYCRSIKMRRRARYLIDPSQIFKLQEWYETPDVFPILVVNGRGLRNAARDFSVELLDMLRASEVPTIWAVSQSTPDDKVGLSPTDILLSLSMQALTLNPQALNQGTDPMSSYHFQNASTEDQGFKLLNRSVSGIPKMFIVLDMAVVNAAVDYHWTRASSFIQQFLDLLRNRREKGIKMIIAGEDSDNKFDIEEQDELNESQIFVGAQSPGRLKRGGARLTRYSSHVFPLRSGTKNVISFLSTTPDTSGK